MFLEAQRRRGEATDASPQRMLCTGPFSLGSETSTTSKISDEVRFGISCLLTTEHTKKSSPTRCQKQKPQPGSCSRGEYRDQAAPEGNATLTSHRQDLTSPKYQLQDGFKFFDAAVTPSLFHASGTWTMTQEIKKTFQTLQRRMVRMIIQMKRKTSIIVTQAHTPRASTLRPTTNPTIPISSLVTTPLNSAKTTNEQGEKQPRCRQQPIRQRSIKRRIRIRNGNHGLTT